MLCVFHRAISLQKQKTLSLTPTTIFFPILFGLLVDCSNTDLNDEPASEPPPPPAVTVPFPEAMFRQNGCEGCHGMGGRGDGYKTRQLNLGTMPDFTNRKSYKHGSSVSSIQKTIQNGIPGTYMKGYRHLKSNEIQALANYVYQFQTQ